MRADLSSSSELCPVAVGSCFIVQPRHPVHRTEPAVAVVVLEEGIEGFGGEDGGLDELHAGGDEDAERQRQWQRQENKARE